MTATTDVDLTAETDEVLAATLQRLLHQYAQADGEERASIHECSMMVITEMGRRTDEWIASLSID